MAKKFPKKICLTILFFIVSLSFVQKEKIKINQRILGFQTEVTNNQESIFGWEQILLEKPDYRDGWLQLASAYYKIGDIGKAKEAMNRAKKLDPVNNIITSLEVLLEAKN